MEKRICYFRIRSILLIALAVLLYVLCGSPSDSFAAEEERTVTYTDENGTITISINKEYDNKCIELGESAYFYIQVTSTMPDTVSFQWSVTKGSGTLEGSESFDYDPEEASDNMHDISFSPDKAGISVVTLSCDKLKMDIPVFTFPTDAYAPVSIKSITQTGLFQLKFELEKQDIYSGYTVFRKDQKGTATEIADIPGGKSTTFTVDVPTWDKKYQYMVQGYLLYNGERFFYPLYWEEWSDEVAVIDTGIQAKPVTKKGAALTVSWKKTAGVKKYTVYQSTTGEYGKYKAVATVLPGSTLSYSFKFKTGVTYSFYVTATLTNGKVSKNGNRVSYFVPNKKLKVVSKVNSSELLKNDSSTYYYSTGKNDYAVQVDGNKLQVYRIGATGKLKKYKTVKLDKFELWGGFYHGPDGRFYVVYGYNNQKESRKKVVIRVVQFSSKWVRMKTAAIKGSAGNVFEGIQTPFLAGTVSMAMKANTLYIHTARTMFVHEDGLNHQSNISFEVNTKTMKAKEAHHNYTSHSFDQYARFKDGDLYLADHGDAYPRAIALTQVQNHGTENERTAEKEVFHFMGATGNNYTGTDMGGMEVGSSHVLLCGDSVPHKKAVKGVKGYTNLAHNVYLITVGRKSGKVSFRWLTSYNPKTSKVTISNVDMIKIHDDRFAILYTTTKNNKTALHYTVVNDAGKTVYSKVYSNVGYTSGAKPILSNGYILWTASKPKQKKVTVQSYWGPYSYYETTYRTVTYRLPVKY